MHRTSTFKLLPIALMLLFSGACGTLDKAYVGVVGMVDPDQKRLTQETRWLNPQPNFRMVSQHKMVVFVRVRDSSGSDLDISRDVRIALEDLGYRLTRNIDEAQYLLSVDLRYYGENARADGGRATMAAGIGGAIVGGIVGHQSGRGVEGATVGALATGMLFNVAASRNKVREFDIVADVRVGERIEGGVSTTRRSGEDSSISHSGGAFSGGSDRSSSRSSSGETQQVHIEEDFLYSQNRLIVFVRKLNLSPDEAAPVLENRLIKALSNVLP